MGLEDQKPYKNQSKGDCAEYCKYADYCQQSLVWTLCIDYRWKDFTIKQPKKDEPYKRYYSNNV